MRRTPLAAFAALALFAAAARADVKPHPLISDGMVLQQGVKCTLWGTAEPGEVVGGSLGKFAPTDFILPIKGVKADADGRWSLTLPAQKAGGPYTLTLVGKNKVTVKDVYVGEVWVCSGQSNMEWPLRLTDDADAAIKAAKHPQIRLFTVPKATSATPRATVAGRWAACDPKEAANFSAVAYHFGVDLHKKLKVPIGLIHSSWGGTVAEAWTGRAALAAEPSLKYLVDNFDKAVSGYERSVNGYLTTLEEYVPAARKAWADKKVLPPPPPPPANPANNPNSPTVLYNAMIKPLQPYALKGVIWYQGESNASRAYEYRTLLPTMIKNWRDDWKCGDFPFLVVQLAPWMAIVKEPQESAWAELREAQLLTTSKVPMTGLAVITDVGDPADIHPRKKGPVGARLALAARAIAYGEKVAYSGPVYDKHEVDGDKVVLRFTHVGKGLEARGGALTGFTVAGADGKFYNAQAEVQGDTVVVRSDRVKKPAAVRYGWANCPVVNLWNKDGLPATPFRTDDFPMVTAPKKK